MDDEQQYSASPPRAALMVRSHYSSLVWIIPLAAAITAVWLGWHSYTSEGPTITIGFETASGIEAGMTKIKYKDADLGIVKTIEPTADLSHFIVTARMKKVAEPYLTKDARFWMVKPSIYNKDLSGLGTFISGAYIEFEPGKGKASRHFVGEQSPAIVPADEPGETYTLHAMQLGSIQQGTPVYFHGIKVGEVLGYELSDKDGSASVRLFVHAPHNTLVRTGTRFWNTSGISVLIGSTGLRIQLESIQSLLTGGIAFDVPPYSEAGAPANPDTSFRLYTDETSAQDSVYTKRLRFLLRFAEPVSGIAVGSPVHMQGLVVGQVSDIHVDYDNGTGHLGVLATIEVEADRIQLRRGNADLSPFEGNALDLFRKLVLSGLRASVGSGNLLTGQKIIDLNLVSAATPATLIEGGAYPEIPTTDGNDIDAVIRSAKNVLNSLQKAANSANTVLSDGNDGGDLAGTLRELKNAARSMRVLTDYLEAHPEAVLRGKPKDGEQ